MITENVSTLKIHKLTQAQYDRELEAGNIDENALYLTPDEGGDSNVVPLTDEEIENICSFDDDNIANSIPIATHSSIGCVSAGDGLDIDAEGNLSIIEITDEEIESICEFDEGMTEDNVIPKATKTALGCIKVGDGLTIDSAGKLSATGGGSGVATAGIGSAGMKLLWENPDPTVAFAAQAVEFDYSEHDFIICVGNLGEGISDYYISSARIPAKSGAKGFLINVSTDFFAMSRELTLTDTGAEFTSASMVRLSDDSTYSDWNNRAIPVAIYGIDIAPPNVDYTLTEEKDVKELLWENPNTTVNFAAQTINLDLSEYDSIQIVFRSTTTSEHRRIFDCIVGNKQQAFSWVSAGVTSTTQLYSRNFTTSSTGIAFEGGKHKAVSGTDAVSADESLIPVFIYGIKNKINVTTAVVTDKGQHTDLLWENASPTAGFAAQTIALDLNGYDGIEVVYTLDYTTEIRKSMRIDVGHTGQIDVIGQSSGKPFVGRRNIEVNKEDIKFELAYYVHGTTSNWESSPIHIIPLAIYGIKHNAATTSTIMGDYIVEEGSDDIWTWRKWNSGIAECWGKNKVTVPASGWTAWGNLFLKSVNAINYPFTFVEVPFDTINVAMNGGNGMTNAYNDGTATTTARMDIVRANNLSAECSGFVKYYAKGRWK